MIKIIKIFNQMHYLVYKIFSHVCLIIFKHIRGTEKTV